MLNILAVANYRSLRDLVMPLGRLNVITGPNGSGKSSVYRAVRLLAETAQGGVIAALSREGGLDSTLWAGIDEASPAAKRGARNIQTASRDGPVNLRMGFADDDFSYAIDIGMPIPGVSQFNRDPEIKRECIWTGEKLRPSTLQADRRGALVKVRGDDDDWQIMSQHLAAFDCMLTQIADPHRAPEVLMLRERIRRWRFYDHFRTDADAPARQPQLGTRTPILAHDGRDLAAAMQTIREIGDTKGLDEAVDDAFPGAEVVIESLDGRFSLQMRQEGLLRPLGAAELSDGTLRYLLLIAALLTPRPPPLMVLNEPETSLHPDLLPALGRLIRHAARESQVWIVSHAPRLIAALEQDEDCQSIHLEKTFGETKIAGQTMLNAPSWQWPDR